jgi:ubiquinone/menaquinone biosynthesis C-methylase UbiE
VIPLTERNLHEYYDRKAANIDEIAATYEHVNWYKRFFYQTRFLAVFSSLDPSPNQLILDVGSGPGYYSARIAHEGAKAISLDLSRNYLGQIPATVGQRLVGHATCLPFRPQTFDKVLATEVLEHVLEPERMLAEIARVLKPHGRAVITSPSGTSYMDRLYRLKTAIGRYAFTEHLREFSPANFARLLSGVFRICGLRFVNCLVPYPLDMIAMRVPEHTGRRIITRLEDSFSNGRGGRHFCWTMIATVEKL